MQKTLAFAAAALIAATGSAAAQDTKVAIGMSGWTGFQPLTLARDAGIFKKNGLDVSLKMIPQKDRHLAIASGDIQCAATTVETWIVWNASGVATKQIFQMDKSYGADGMAVRGSVAKIAGHASASVTRRTTCQMLAPLMAADSSSAGSIERNAAVMRRKAIGE